MTLDGTATAEQVNADHLAQQVRALETRVSQMRGQMHTIAQMLLEEAENRDFCSEYDRFVDNVNEAIGEEILLHRVREFIVNFSGTMSIEATTAELARTECEEQLNKMEDRCDHSVGFSTNDVEIV